MEVKVRMLAGRLAVADAACSCCMSTPSCSREGQWMLEGREVDWAVEERTLESMAMREKANGRPALWAQARAQVEWRAWLSG